MKKKAMTLDAWSRLAQQLSGVLDGLRDSILHAWPIGSAQHDAAKARHSENLQPLVAQIITERDLARAKLKALAETVEALLRPSPCARCEGYGCSRCSDPYCRGRGCPDCTRSCIKPPPREQRAAEVDVALLAAKETA